jgi:hypothetical protein
VKPMTTIRAGGLALIVGAIAFMAVFAFLAARFDYPAILDGPASTVLPRLLATGAAGRGAVLLRLPESGEDRSFLRTEPMKGRA